LVDLFAFGMVVILFLWVGATQTTPDPPPPRNPEDPVTEATRERAQRLGDRLKGESADVVFVPNPPAVEVHGLRGRQVFFGTDRYDLDTGDREAVATLSQLVEREIRNQPEFVVLVNGTADPRPFKSPIPPRDNVELSALRAAAVSKILVDAGLKGRLQVVGLAGC
jgi:flagellar motor protein MotB